MTPTAADLVFEQFRKLFDVPSLHCNCFENYMIYPITKDYDRQKQIIKEVEEIIVAHGLPLVAKINRGLPSYKGTLVISYFNPAADVIFAKNKIGSSLNKFL